MGDDLEALLRAAGIPDAGRAEALWAEYRSGGPGADAAFHTLLAWYGLALYRRVWGFVRSDAADDVFQDVLAKLHRNRARLATWADAHRWLRTVAVREAVSSHRRDRRRQAREARRAVRPDDADTGDTTVQAVMQAELRAALAKLPEADRQVVALLYFEGLTATDAARVLGKNRDTVAAWQARALGRLRKLMPAAGVTVGGSAGVEGVLAAGRPFVPAARLGELARSALTRVLPGPSLGTAAAVLVAGLTLGGAGLAGWAAMPAPEPASAQVPSPKGEPTPVVERETLQAQNLRILHAEVLPKLTAGVAKLVGTEPVVTHTRAEGSDVYVHLEGRHPLPGYKDRPRAQMRFCVLSRTLTNRLDLSGTGDWKMADADNVRVTVEAFGRKLSADVSIRQLGLRVAFDALPADPRAAAEFDRFHLHGTPYGGPELIVPHWQPSLAGNGRYLYVAREGVLLARDARSEFIGWRRIGTFRDWRDGRLTADDQSLYWADGRQLWVRPADPGPHEWRLFGPLPPGGDPIDRWMFAAAGGRVFGLAPDGRLWSRPAGRGLHGWEPAGVVREPDYRTAFFADAERLYLLHGFHKVWVRPALADGPWAPSFDVPGTFHAAHWAGRVICWNPRNDRGVEARPLPPGSADWVRIGRVAGKDEFLNWRW
ncbi:MAG: RNA polymerase sigma factor [Gemmataceae bacterium]|nr:RNA polymerase sigma factor [Gemmataceae bacterium]